MTTDEREWCVDERHGEPCRSSCSVCRDECDPERRATTAEAEAAHPGWTPWSPDELPITEVSDEAIR